MSGQVVCLASLVWAAALAAPLTGPVAAINSVLDDFHDAASKADGRRYFAHFAPDGVFLGTDASERWGVAAFKAYAQPHFAKGQGWTYVPSDRHVVLGPSGATAWFDELLTNAKYGTLRGSGVLRLIDGRWRIAQYNLAFTVPNERTKQVVDAMAPGTP